MVWRESATPKGFSDELTKAGQLQSCRDLSTSDLPTVVVGVEWESKVVAYIRKYSMSTKFSIVTSAADGCGKPSSIRSMGNSYRSNMDRKGSFMLSNRSSAANGYPMVVAALAVVALSGVASATSVANLVNVEFGQGNSGSYGTVGSAVWETQTPYSLNSSSDIWNRTAYGVINNQSSPLALENTTGSSTGLDLTLSVSGADGGNTYVGFNNNPDPLLYNTYLDEHGATAFSNAAYAQVSGLSTGVRYDLVLYPNGSTVTEFLVTGSGTYGPESISSYQGSSNLTATGVTQTTFDLPTNTDPSSAGTSANVGNYLQFDNISPNSNGAIDIQFFGVPGFGGEGDFSGFQIAPASAAPETTTLGLLGVASLGLLLICRKRAAIRGA